MVSIRYALEEDEMFWFSLDKHIASSEFKKKVKEKQAYVIFDEQKPVGILRYQLFWDELPFCNLLYIDKKYQGQGYGKKLMSFFEEEMKNLGYPLVLVSTQVDESAQHFYRKLGYEDCGGLLLKGQAMELFLIKYF